jgi:hypothetical protein
MFGRKAALVLAFFIAIPVAAGDENRDAERAHEARGKQLFRARHYAAAAAEFVEAYEAVEDAGLLFEMGQSYRLAGEKQNALAAYRSYLRRGARGSKQKAVVGYIAELNRALGNPPEKFEKPERGKKGKLKRGAPIAATVATAAPPSEPPPSPPEPEEPPSTPPAPPPPTTTVATATTTKTPATTPPTTAPPTVETPPAPPPTVAPENPPPVIVKETPAPRPSPPIEKPGRALVASGAVIVVAGVVVAVVGVLFGVKAMQLGDDLTNAKPGTVFDPALDAIAKTDQTLSIALGAAGGALAVAGAAMAIIGWRRGRAAPVAIFPSLSRDDATLSLVVRF